MICAAEGAQFAEVETSSGVMGFVQAKYLVKVDPDPDAGALSPVHAQDVALEMSVIAPAIDLATGGGSFAQIPTESQKILMPLMELQKLHGTVPGPAFPPHGGLPSHATAVVPVTTLAAQAAVVSPASFGPLNLSPQLPPPRLPSLGSPPAFPPPVKNMFNNHFMLWSDDKVRNQFLIFFSVYVIWAALDIAFDVLFAVESSRILELELPSSLPLRHFFPATVAVLGSSMLLTMYANIPVFRRFVLVSREQHEEESQGNSRLVWQEFAPAVAAVFRALLAQPVSGAFSSMLQEVRNEFQPAASAPGSPVPDARESLVMFLISGPSNVLRAVEWLSKAASVLLQNVICLCSLSVSGKWELFDKLDRETLYPSIFAIQQAHCGLV